MTIYLSDEYAHTTSLPADVRAICALQVGLLSKQITNAFRNYHLNLKKKRQENGKDSDLKDTGLLSPTSSTSPDSQVSNLHSPEKPSKLDPYEQLCEPNLNKSSENYLHFHFSHLIHH